MEDYIRSNKEAWEEAFDLRDASYGADIEEQVQTQPYAFFNEDTANILKKYDLRGKSIAQFCCNNGRELLSLVKTTGAKEGVGFDIAANMVAFANEKAAKLNLPCHFVEANILELDDTYKEAFDFVFITIGGTCWFKSLQEYFAVIAKCLKKGGCIVINDTHPVGNMIATPGDEGYDDKTPTNIVFSYFEHEWIGTGGMYYMTGREYASKTFTDYTHSLSEFIDGLCANGIVVTGLKEYDYDISGGFPQISGRRIPLSMILEGRLQ